MGSWTSFLNLFKPAKTDSYNVITQQDDNWDKIDAGVKVLNDNKAHILKLNRDYVSCSTLAELQSAVKQHADLMGSRTVSFGVVNLTASFAPFNGGTWSYMIKKGTNIYFTVTFEWMNGAGTTYPIYAQYENGTWIYDALNSNVNNKVTSLIRDYVAANSTNTYENIDMRYAVIIAGRGSISKFNIWFCDNDGDFSTLGNSINLEITYNKSINQLKIKNTGSSTIYYNVMK